MRKQLTELMIDRLSPPLAGRLEIFDAIVPALALRVTPAGAKTFVVRTRVRGRPSPVRITVGDARGMKLMAARQAASEILRQCRAGEDPRPKAAVRGEAPDPLLWEQVVETFIQKHARPRNRSWGQTRALFASRVTPYWRGKLIGDIGRAEVVAVLDRAEATSIYRSNRVLAAVRKLFNWAVLRGLIAASPIVPGMTRRGEVKRDRYLTFEEIRLVWRAADRIGQPFGPMFKLLLITAQRRGELTNMEWAAIDLDEERLWSLTSADTKAGRAHLVPLTAIAVELLRGQPLIDDPELAGAHAQAGRNRSKAVYVFSTNGRAPVSGFSKAKRHLDAAILAILQDEAIAKGEDLAEVRGPPSWRVHDLRRSVATHLEDALGVPPHIIGSILNHAPGSYKGVTAVYTRGALIYERRRALVAWSRLLGLAVDGGDAWNGIAHLLRPETEADAARTDEFRRMAFADEAGWRSYLKTVNSAAGLARRYG